MPDVRPDLVVGIGVNPLAPRLAHTLAAAVAAAGLRSRLIDLTTLHVRIAGSGSTVCRDVHGEVAVTHLAPALLYWQEAAAAAYACMELTAHVLNPVAAVHRADDKAATATVLAVAGVPQLTTWVVGQELTALAEAAAAVRFPVVVKRTHGAQGRWVRLARNADELTAVHAELVAEGRGPLLVQRHVAEAAGRSLRVITTAGAVVAATERTAPPGELHSNVSAGGRQAAVRLAPAEAELARAATAAVGLGHAGVDLLRTADGPVVLEVNACPDFTSMRAHVDTDIAAAVVAAVTRR